jgi:hypothetical protein
MLRIPRHVVVGGVSLLVAATAGLFVLRSGSGTTNLAFWFDTISDDARTTLPDRLPDGVSPEDMRLIEAASREEIVRAFRGYPIAIVERVAAHYRVRVVDSLNGPYGGSAESYALPGFGGHGFVSFRALAHGAIVHAPPDADRQEIVAAIGRGIGRAAVHEFTHQILGRQARIDESKDVQSYEYGSATRREQYYGQMRWDIAEPLLRERFGID